FFHTRALDTIQAKLVALLRERKEVGPGDIKDLLGISRKYAIPLLEFFDQRRVTARVGERRILRAGEVGSKVGIVLGKELHMFGLGYQELLIILVIVLILFGANRLPQLARSLGSSVKEFKKGVNEVKAEDTAAAAKKSEENKT